jgi:hypothetical protein
MAAGQNNLYDLLIIFVLMIFTSIPLYGQTYQKVNDVKWKKTKDSKLEITYSLSNTIEGENYKLAISFYDKKNSQLPAFSLSGDYSVVSEAGKKIIVWDVLKDIQDFPIVSKVEIKIIQTILDPNQTKQYAVSDSINLPSENSGSNIWLGTKGGIGGQANNNRNNDNRDYTSFQLYLFNYEYDVNGETSKFSFLGCGGYGFTWVPITIERVKIDDNSTSSLISPFMNLIFKCGGGITNFLDICLMGEIGYGTNSLTAEDTKDKSKNTDKISNTKYFYGLQLKTHFLPANLYIKAGFADSRGNIEHVLPNKNYAPRIDFGTGQYFTIMVGIKIMDSSNDFVRLW